MNDEQQQAIDNLFTVAIGTTDPANRMVAMEQLRRVLSESQARVEQLEKELKLQREMLAAVKHTVVATIGGADHEGFPTSEINYLQRLRILLEKERENERLREAIQKAPHAWTCEALTFNCHEDCTCWKREALAPTPKPTIGHYHSASGHRLPCALTDPHACYCEVGESDPPRTEAGE